MHSHIFFFFKKLMVRIILISSYESTYQYSYNALSKLEYVDLMIGDLQMSKLLIILKLNM